MKKYEESSITGIRAIKSILDDPTRLYYFIFRIKNKIRETEDNDERERLMKLLNEIEKYRPDNPEQW